MLDLVYSQSIITSTGQQYRACHDPKELLIENCYRVYKLQMAKSDCNYQLEKEREISRERHLIPEAQTVGQL